MEGKVEDSAFGKLVFETIEKEDIQLLRTLLGTKKARRDFLDYLATRDKPFNPFRPFDHLDDQFGNVLTGRSIEIVRFLLDDEELAEKEMEALGGPIAISMAIDDDDIEVAKILIEDKRIRVSEFDIEIEIALREGREEMALLILKYQKDVLDFGGRPKLLRLAKDLGHTRVVDLLDRKDGYIGLMDALGTLPPFRL